MTEDQIAQERFYRGGIKMCDCGWNCTIWDGKHLENCWCRQIARWILETIGSKFF